MAQHHKPSRHLGYHLMVTGLLGGLIFTAVACTDDEQQPAAPTPAVEVVTPQPEPTPVPPAEVDPAPAEPVEAAAVEDTDPEPQEEIPSNDDVRPGYGPEDCGASNEGPGMTQAEWIEFCYPNTIEDLPGDDFYPDDEPVACQGYGCSDEQDALLNEAEAAANAGY